MICANCDTNFELSNPQIQDYLCKHCRVLKDPEAWELRAKVQRSVSQYLIAREKMYYGFELQFPEDSQFASWAILTIYDEPQSHHVDRLGRNPDIGSQFLLNEWIEKTKLPKLYVWTTTGVIYQLGSDGAIVDDPVFVPYP